MADSEKLGRSAPIVLAEPATVDMLVTEAPPPPIADLLTQNDVDIVLAGAGRGG